MIEEIVTFETAKLLKRCGFNEETYAYYEQEELMYEKYEYPFRKWNDIWDGYVSAPTHGLAMKWLREEKNVVIWVRTCHRSVHGEFLGYIVHLEVNPKKLELSWLISCLTPTYEQAAEAGIQAACRYLLSA